MPAVMAGAGLAFYAMIGFEDSVNVAEEAEDPQRNDARALFNHYRAPTVLPVLGAVISVAVMFTKEADIFLRAGLLLLVGVAFWALNAVLLHRTGPADTAEWQAVEHPDAVR